MLIGIFGILGNGVSVAIFGLSKPLRMIITNQFLLHQSVIDFLASVFLVSTIRVTSNTGFEEGLRSYLICALWNTSFVVWTTLLVSTFNLLALSVERWLKVNFVMFMLHLILGFGHFNEMSNELNWPIYRNEQFYKLNVAFK